jgi:hypothetical protein
MKKPVNPNEIVSYTALRPNCKMKADPMKKMARQNLAIDRGNGSRLCQQLIQALFPLVLKTGSLTVAAQFNASVGVSGMMPVLQTRDSL